MPTLLIHKGFTLWYYWIPLAIKGLRKPRFKTWIICIQPDSRDLRVCFVDINFAVLAAVYMEAQKPGCASQAYNFKDQSLLYSRSSFQKEILLTEIKLLPTVQLANSPLATNTST